MQTVQLLLKPTGVQLPKREERISVCRICQDVQLFHLNFKHDELAMGIVDIRCRFWRRIGSGHCP